MGKINPQISEITSEEKFKQQLGGIKMQLVHWQSSGHSSALQGGNNWSLCHRSKCGFRQSDKDKQNITV